MAASLAMSPRLVRTHSQRETRRGIVAAVLVALAWAKRLSFQQSLFLANPTDNLSLLLYCGIGLS